MTHDIDVLEKVCRAVQRASNKGLAPKASHRLVDDLGFDSLRMSSLAIALEGEFRQPFLLSDWISVAEDPSHLTVQSLADYLSTVLAEDR